MSTALPIHRRLETHVALAVTVVVFFALGAALLIATRVVTSGSFERATMDLDGARSTFYRVEDDRANFASSQAQLVATLPIFRAYLTDSRLAGDLASMQVLADQYREQLDAAFAIVTAKTGTWAGRSGWQNAEAPPAALTAMIAGAVGGRPQRAIVAIGDQPYLVVSAPARFAQETVGTFTVGYVLDDAFARQLAQSTHSEVTIAIGSRVAASSLSGAQRAAAVQLVASGQIPSLSTTRIEPVGSGEYVAGAFPVSSNAAADSPVRLLLMQDWTPVQHYLNQLRSQLFEAGAIIFAVSLAGGLIFARRLSRPLTDMAAAAREIADGHWSRRVPVSGSAEATTLAVAFNAMTSNLRHWYDEARKRDDELRQAQKMEAVGRLAGGIAHDFNNVLTAIRGYAELAIVQLKDNTAVQSNVVEVVAAADRAADLTKQLLAFSRRQAAAPRVLALDRVLSGMHQLVSRVIGEDVPVVMAIAPAIGPVRADRTQIEQVILNLVVNARDAMPDGGTVTLSVVNTDDNRVRLSVGDTGQGMDAQTVARIFDPFFTTKESGRGTGLGLAIVYSIVHEAGGEITVETAVGRGTTFSIFLPRLPDGTPVDEELDLRKALAGLRSGTETVLVAEDDERLSTLIGSTLRQAGYNVMTAAHGEEALQIARNHEEPIHLLLADVVMPGMNGRMLSQQLRTFRPDTTVLYMSGYSDEAVRRHGIEMASAHYIQKPFSMDALMIKMRETLLQSRA